MTALDPRAWLEVVRTHPRVFAGVAAALGIAFGPFVAWRLQPSRTLEVVVLDKTVPFERYREHAAIPWLLHATKTKRRDGTFLTETDYVGFDPKTRTGRELVAEDLAHADVLVVADTYGVYASDYDASGDTTKLHGGVTDAEATVIESFATAGGVVVAEFNTFGTPTAPPVRARLERLFGVRATGWVARYWPDLADALEVPPWIRRVWERRRGTPFAFTGGGLVFVRDDEDIVVLRAGEELTGDPVVQERTSAGAVFALPERGGFRFWMDVVEETDGEVLYEHVVGSSDAGRAELAAHGLPSRFPAIVKRRDAWYFAGDFVDTPVDLGDPERAGVLTWRSYMNGFGGAMSEDRSFWSFYVPVFLRIVGARAR